VIENVNVEPPLADERTTGALLFDDTVKSDDSAVVAPEMPEAATLQTTGTPTRCGDENTHCSEDADVGLPMIKNVGIPLTIVVPPTSTRTPKAAVAVCADTENTNVDPPFDVVGTIICASVAVMVKSDQTPVVGPN
jgi:hypothetical protein